MENNVFTFGSRFFVQTNGTAMGTNLACMYATIYYSYYEETELRFLPYNKFYRRLIDDSLIIVDADTSWEHLKNKMNNFGPVEKRLTWTTEKLSDTVNFPDLTLTMQEDGTITYKTFQKPDNFFLYRTPDSCQPANILTSFVFSTLQRYYHQNTFTADYDHFTLFLFHNMMERGHINHSLRKIFTTQSEKARNSKMPHVTRTPPIYISNNTRTKTRRLFVHNPHHPNNPTHKELTSLANTLKEAINKEREEGLDRIIIAYSKATNIGSLCKKHQLEQHINTHHRN